VPQIIAHFKVFVVLLARSCDNAGKYYYEATVTDEGLCRVGWSTLKATLDLGTDKEGFGFGGTGKKSFGRQFDTYGEVRISCLTNVFLSLLINRSRRSETYEGHP